jgi:hypothetical protein
LIQISVVRRFALLLVVCVLAWQLKMDSGAAKAGSGSCAISFGFQAAPNGVLGTSLAVSSDQIFVGASDGKLRIISPHVSLSEGSVVDVSPSALTALSVSATTRSVFVGTNDGQLFDVSMASGVVQPLMLLADPIIRVDNNANSIWAFSKSGYGIADRKGHILGRNMAGIVSIVSHGEHFFIATENGLIQKVGSDGNVVAAIDLKVKVTVATSSDRNFVVGGPDGKVRVLDQSLKVVNTFESLFKTPITALTASGGRVLFGDRNGEVYLVRSVTRGVPVVVHRFTLEVTGVAVLNGYFVLSSLLGEFALIDQQRLVDVPIYGRKSRLRIGAVVGSGDLASFSQVPEEKNAAAYVLWLERKASCSQSDITRSLNAAPQLQYGS